MDTCRTCKHWAAEDWAIDPERGRACRSPLLLHESICSANLHARAALADSSEYHIALFTGPDFGRVNHEPA